MKDFVSEFLAFMRSHGFEPKGKLVADDKWHQATAPGDTKGKYSGAYSMKVVSSDFAIGCLFSRKDPDTKLKWHSKSDEKLDPAELKKIKKLIEEQQQQQEIDERKRHDKIARRLSAYYKRQPKSDIGHPYLVRKQIANHGLRYRAKGNELIIPLYASDGKLYTIQRINAAGGKYLFTGGRKQGSYFPLCSAEEDKSLMLIAEGFATAASIREATGLPVIVAVDSGNLKPVIVALKSKYPRSRFLICADNDAFTTNAKGEPWNVGIEKAKQAAEAVGGAYVVAPDIINEKNTDFNDLHVAAGIEEVKRQIMEVVAKIPAPPTQEEAASMDEASSALNQHHAGGDIPPPEDYSNREYDYELEAANTDPLQGDFRMNYKVLGYNREHYYYFSFKARIIVALTAGGHTLNSLFRLDTMENWQRIFGMGGEVSEKKIVTYATNALMALAHARGVFKEEDRVRGCGAWMDAGRKILHCGDMLYVDGVETKFDQLKSEYTYVAAGKVMRPALTPMNNKEAFALRQICEAVTWENKLSGSLLAGWLVIAPVCGALTFRPHLYITGEAESGKSTVLNKIIKPVLGRISINFDGGTTEPAVRQAMEYDARPIVYDEAEKDIHMPAVIALARKASTGATIKKFGQGLMNARFCACFSAINPPVSKTADESRIAFMTIKKNRRGTAMEEYNQLLEMIDKTITPDYSSRMIARTLANLDTLFENIKTFQKAARKIIRGARASEVIGTMLAGLYLLSKTDIITPEAAEEWVAKHDWTNHTIIDEDTDPARLLQFLSGSLLRLQLNGMSRDMSIGDLIVMAHEKDTFADKLLRYNGIAVKDGKVHIASRSHNLEKMLRDTDWSARWTKMLSNIDGAEAFKIFYFGVGVKTSGVSLPIKLFSEEREKPVDLFPEAEITEEEIPF